MSDEERFWSKVALGDINGCWLWLASRQKNGYGRFRVGSSMERAHRVAYALTVGPVPEGLELDHLCRVRHCVNPAHLEPVTHVENCRRGGNAVKTHCPQGHPYDAGNTLYAGNDGFRRCRICHMERMRLYRRAG